MKRKFIAKKSENIALTSLGQKFYEIQGMKDRKMNIKGIYELKSCNFFYFTYAVLIFRF